jgi:hypothetical protein
MKKVLRALFQWHVFAILVLYAFLIADRYPRYLDGRLRYIGQPGAAPEDILGGALLLLPLGIWFILTCVFLAAANIGKKRYWIAFLGTAIVLVVIDQVLLAILERQVVGG